jgi:hypothetical protein
VDDHGDVQRLERELTPVAAHGGGTVAVDGDSERLGDLTLRATRRRAERDSK